MKIEIKSVAQFKAAFFENLDFFIPTNDKIRSDFASFDRYIDSYGELVNDISAPRSLPARRTRKAWFAEMLALVQ